ncbi:FAD-dependent oxidoreductase [Chitinimonas sp. BJB300]|uniref:FAD-dependent oxidoreductase n=1 Tax=Chitinimonas sp. BJB300 TaxID=1559339 RepID=UPI000C0D6628|nr:GMC family oxidoreductase [Chitinimonas sp. BJB300]PHV10605.1 glucose-methanol-choline oxidoreductase [Chitinimonas sp. BJB300]TSJ86076.1 GMC family oxidoreductase [Chitinimonas sp. BJB300]
MQSDYDAIVIGAGVGGSNVAAELAAAGWRCLVIEAGRYYSRLDSPRGELDGNAKLFWHGGLELNRSASIAMLRARVVGGGSIVNQALLDEFDSVALDDWRKRTGLQWLSETGMAPWYTRARGALHIQPVSEVHANRNAQLFRQGFEACGYGCATLQRGQSGCRHEEGNDCIECLYGCRLDSKQSTPLTSLQAALKSGAKLLTECEVETVSEEAGQVTVRARLANGQPQVFRAGQLVLAAGTLGSNALLMRSGWGARLPVLGQGYYCHPQFMYFARYREPVNAQRGPFQAYKSDEPTFRAQGFKLENVFSPPIGTALLLPGLGRDHQISMAAMRHYACIEVAVRDTHPGRISLAAGGRLCIDKELDKEDKRRATAGYQAVRNVFRATGAEAILPGRFGIGLHLMGGLRFARRPEEGCVAGDYRLFGSQRIHVADASLFPSAPGINPSLTIMALARRLGCQMAEAA